MFSSIVFFKQKTAYEMRISDWSSDVCSSDLCIGLFPALGVFDRNSGKRHDGISDKGRTALPSNIPSRWWYPVALGRSVWDTYTTKNHRNQPVMASSDILWERMLVTPTGIEPVFQPCEGRVLTARRRGLR